jgi:hypothetical protein
VVKPKQAEVVVDRRRKKTDRRNPSASGVSKPEGERRKVQRRRQIDPTTCERDYSNDEIEFMQALDAYKRTSGRMFPTCSEILEVIRNLGYVRLADEGEQATGLESDAAVVAEAELDASDEAAELEEEIEAVSETAAS